MGQLCVLSSCTSGWQYYKLFNVQCTQLIDDDYAPEQTVITPIENDADETLVDTVQPSSLPSNDHCSDDEVSYYCIY